MKILVATDGSRGSTAALSFAARLASRDEGSELIVLTVDSSDGAGVGKKSPHAFTEELAATRHQAQKALDSAARRMSHQRSPATFRLVSAKRQEEIPEAISREADRQKVDLVVVGSEGRDTLNEWVVGGVALRLIYVARRPVTVVRPPRRRKTR